MPTDLCVKRDRLLREWAFELFETDGELLHRQEGRVYLSVLLRVLLLSTVLLSARDVAVEGRAGVELR